MVNIAIIEGSDADAEKLLGCLEAFAQECGEEFSYTRYRDANSFLEERGKIFDLIFTEVQLRGIDGMEAAVRLRKSNASVRLVFVTQTAAYAAKSYEVDALDYILKPYTYKRLTLRLRRALSALGAEEGVLLMIRDKAGPVQISSERVSYVEIHRHKLTYHTEQGEFSEIGSMKRVEEALSRYHFALCNACYLVNLKEVFRIKGYMLTMKNGDVLKISQPKRKDFLATLRRYHENVKHI